MRALHLLGLRRPGLTRLRYMGPTYEPLILPSWIPPADREVLLAFYQQILGDETLTRIEVDWDYSLLPVDATYLQHARLRHGAGQDLAVVRVRRPGVDLLDVLAPSDLSAFQHTAIVCDHPALNESVGGLRALAELVDATAQELYEELAEELPLRGDGIALIAPLVRTLLNPILVLEAYNALIRLHGEPIKPEEHRDAVYRSVLGRLLDDLPADDLVGLAALVLRGPAGLAQAVGVRSEAVEASLRARMVILDGRLTRWARFLGEPSLRGLVEDRIRRLTAPRAPIDGLEKVERWLSQGPPVPRVGDPLISDVFAVSLWIKEGKLGRAADTLAALEPRLDEAQVTDTTRGSFWRSVCQIRAAEGRWSEADLGFRRSLAFFERAGSIPKGRALMMRSFAARLRTAGRLDEARTLDDEAARLDITVPSLDPEPP